MMSVAIANGMELQKVDIEQAFLQADKLDQGVNGRYFINPPPTRFAFELLAAQQVPPIPGETRLAAAYRVLAYVRGL